MMSRNLRGVLFLFLGTVFGTLLALGLGWAFSTGIQSTMMFELIIYGVVGAIAGFFLGLFAHIFTGDREESEGGEFLGGITGGINGGVVGGIVMIVVAVVWFTVAYFGAGRIYFYPPILLVIGILAILRGLEVID